MSSIEHHATVEKGLKMKIKRKNISGEKTEKQTKKEQNKPENWKPGSSECTKTLSAESQSANGMLADKASKLSLFGDKDKSPKSKSALGKKDKGKGQVKSDNSAGLGFSGAGMTQNGVESSASLFGQSNMEPKLGETAKRESMPDPYEFNAKVEDGISSLPMKKLKVEKDNKIEMLTSSSMSAGSGSQMACQSTSVTQDASTDTQDVAVSTEPECLGPCEPGTQVNLEGIVWHESETGVLVVNVTWRGKTYVGTLLDATRHDWAPPRFNCDSPSIEFESRTPKGRGKRRGASNTPVNDTRTLRKGRRGSNQQTFTAPPSPAKSDISTGSLKRKGRPQDIDLSAAEQRSSKRSRSGSQVPTPNLETPPVTDAQGYIECPEPKCNKKYRHANGLKYHQSHAHSSNSNSNSSTSFDDGKEMDISDDIPLSVMKNTVKKEKEEKMECNSNKKESPKESNKDSNDPISDKNKSDNAFSKKSDKDVIESDTKDISQKSETKRDTVTNSLKKKETTSIGASSKSLSVPLSVSTTNNSVGKTPMSLNSTAKTSLNSLSVHTTSSQGPTHISTLLPPSQIALSSSASSLASLSNTVSSIVLAPSVMQSEILKSDTTKLVDIKPKITQDVRVSKPNRPIVPAPVPQANVQVTHSNLQPIVSNAQMSPQLKAIQPKPTIMGEPQNMNPALAEFNKDRKKAQKKKPKESVQNSNNRPDQPTIKIERTGVIKTNPLPNHKQSEQHKKDLHGSIKDNSRQGSDTNRSHTSGNHPHKLGEMSHSRINQNPNLLKVGSPLQVTTPDNHNNKNPVSDDVQSPAYSDISDANESASPAAASESSPQKQKEENTYKKEEKSETPPQQQGDGQMVPHYNMYYGNYAQSPYNMSSMSPGQKSNSSTSSGVAQPSQSSNQNNVNKEQMKSASGSEEKKQSSDDQVKGDKSSKHDDKDMNRPKMIPPHLTGPPPSNLSPHQLHEYQMQQNWYQQMYLQSLPRHVQYQHMAAANGAWIQPPMDPAYAQQMMEEQRRMQGGGDPGRNEREGGHMGPGGPGNPQGQEGPRHAPGHDMQRQGADMKSGSGLSGALRKDDNKLSGQKQSIPSPGLGRTGERGDSNIKPSDEKNQALRDKQNENHQILKENIDIKNEMDKQQSNRGQGEYERYRQQEEMRRYKMYQEQKMIEERKKMEMAARKGESRPENLTNKAPGTKPIEHSGNSRNLLPSQRSLEERDREVSIKREPGVLDTKSKDSRESHSRESHSRDSSKDSRDSNTSKYSDSSKGTEEKSKTPISDKHRSESVHRNPETPKHRPGGSSSKSGSPSTSLSSSLPGSPSYSPFVNNQYPPYMQNPQFMGVDPNHPMYRSQHINPVLMSGYPANYIHPSQMVGYRPGSEDDKEKLSAQKPGGPPPNSDSDQKKGESNSGNRSGSGSGPYYGNMHKIHELSEKARPKSRNSSPGPLKPSSDSGIITNTMDKNRDFTNSPPTQRHVHTHHHTHVLQPGIQPTPMVQPPGFSPVYDPYHGVSLNQHML